ADPRSGRRDGAEASAQAVGLEGEPGALLSDRVPAHERTPSSEEGSARDRVPFRVAPMLATLVGAPFHRPGWVYEEKYDGFRILAYKEGERVTLLSRNAKDKTAAFADVARPVGRLRARTLLLDGEVVGFDRELVSRFQ